MKYLYKNILKIIFICFVCGLILLVFTKFFPYDLSGNNFSFLGSVGAWFGGFMSPVLTTITILLLIATLYEQKDSKKMQQFDSILFNQISIHHEILKNLEIINYRGTGESLLAYKYNADYKEVFKNEYKIPTKEYVFKIYNCELDVLYRSAKSILEFIDDNNYLDNNLIKQKYVNTFKRQLSFYQLFFIALIYIRETNISDIFIKYDFFEDVYKQKDNVIVESIKCYLIPIKKVKSKKKVKIKSWRAKMKNLEEVLHKYLIRIYFILFIIVIPVISLILIKLNLEIEWGYFGSVSVGFVTIYMVSVTIKQFNKKSERQYIIDLYNEYKSLDMYEAVKSLYSLLDKNEDTLIYSYCKKNQKDEREKYLTDTNRTIKYQKRLVRKFYEMLSLAYKDNIIDKEFIFKRWPEKTLRILKEVIIPLECFERKNLIKFDVCNFKECNYNELNCEKIDFSKCDQILIKDLHDLYEKSKNYNK